VGVVYCAIVVPQYCNSVSNAHCRSQGCLNRARSLWSERISCKGQVEMAGRRAVGLSCGPDLGMGMRMRWGNPGRAVCVARARWALGTWFISYPGLYFVYILLSCL